MMGEMLKAHHKIHNTNSNTNTYKYKYWSTLCYVYILHSLSPISILHPPPTHILICVFNMIDCIDSFLSSPLPELIQDFLAAWNTLNFNNY